MQPHGFLLNNRSRRMLCSNRDEYLSRPTANTHWHSFGPITSPSADPAAHEQGDVLSGRDLLAGGTWAGVSRTGRVTLLYVSRFIPLLLAPENGRVLVTQLSGLNSSRTNITEPLRKYDSSRGDLTHSFLLPKAPSSSLEAEIDEFLEENRNRAYAGFNLLILSPSPSTIGDLASRGLSYDGASLTNSGGGGTISARMLSGEERRCAGMSNGVDHKGAIEWPKVKHGTQTLRNILQSLPQDATEAEIVDKLFALLT